jgi:hypothetical protein
MKAHRSKLKEQAKGPAVTKAPTRHSAASKLAPAPVTSIARRKSPESKSAQSGKPKSDRAQRREWRSNVVDYLIDCLTDPACPMTGEWYERHRMGSMWLGFYDRLNQIEATVDDKPDVLAELRLCIAIEALRRLCGERPAGSPPALPQKAALT